MLCWCWTAEGLPRLVGEVTYSAKVTISRKRCKILLLQNNNSSDIWPTAWHHFRWPSVTFKVIHVLQAFAKAALPRDAMRARYMLSSCVRPFCRLSVCHKPALYLMAKRRITQTTLYDSPGTLVFWRQRYRRNSDGYPQWGRQMELG